jgi:arylsulfatase A-like enzyme
VSESDITDKPPYLRMREVGSEVPEHLQGGSDVVENARAIRRLQLRTLMSVDDLVGTLLRALGGLNERRDTLAFFLSDNGYLWGEHQAISKRLPYTPSIRVPFLVRYPGHVRPGTRVDRLTTNLDVAPTIADEAGLSASLAPMDGASILDRRPRRLLFFEHWGGHKPTSVPTWHSIRTRGYQFVRNSRGRGEERYEYYDLRRDPAQLVNLLGDDDPANDPSAARISRWLGLIEEYRACAGPACP